MLIDALILMAIAIAGGGVPLVFRSSDRLLHLLVAFATGVFLGMVFLHLLPEVSRLAAGGREAASPLYAAAEGAPLELPEEHGIAAASLWLCVLLGVVGLYLFENLLLRRGAAGEHLGHSLHEHEHAGVQAHALSDHHQHVTVGFASLVGLSVHALIEGFGLGAASAHPELVAPVFLAIAGHKAAVSFSLATVMLLAGFRRPRLVGLLVAFSLATPLGILAGTSLVDGLGQRGIGVLTALAAGTFLFVALVDLLPEVFHHRVDVPAKVALLACGVATAWTFHLVHP